MGLQEAKKGLHIKKKGGVPSVRLVSPHLPSLCAPTCLSSKLTPATLNSIGGASFSVARLQVISMSLSCSVGVVVRVERVSGIVTTHAEHAVAVERRAAREGTQAEAAPTIHMPSEGGVKERAGRSTGLHACTRCCSSPSCLMEPFMAVNIVSVWGGL